MKVEFIAGNPHQSAGPRLEEVLARGTDQRVIACAFCSAEGVRILQRHAKKLCAPSSFAVVSLATPTDRLALMGLHAMIPGHLFYHAVKPVTVKGREGGPLMHSKVFYARSGQAAWLWTGSHNLTKMATSGSNCEAAVLLEGDYREQPFVEALRHMEICKSESQLFPPPPLPLSPTTAPTGKKGLAVYVEAEDPYLGLTGDLIELRLQKANQAALFHIHRPIYLYLYSHGSLANGQPQPDRPPKAAFKGSVLGVNKADSQQIVWQDVSYVVEKSGTCFRLTEPRECSHATTVTQCLFSVTADLTES